MSTTKDNHKTLLTILFTTIILERIVFYGFKSTMIIFLVGSEESGGLGLSDEFAYEQLELFVHFNVFVPILGALLSDFSPSRPITMIIGGILASASIALFSLGFTDLYPYILFSFLLGLAMFELSNYALLASVYKKQKHKLTAIFTLMYLFINIGSFLGTLMSGIIGSTIGWVMGYVSIILIMLIACLIIFSNRNQLHLRAIEEEEGRASNTFSNSKWIIAFVIVVGLVSSAYFEFILLYIHDELPLLLSSEFNDEKLLLLIPFFSTVVISFIGTLILGILWFRYFPNDFIKIGVGLTLIVLSGLLLASEFFDGNPDWRILIMSDTFANLGDILIWPVLYSIIVLCRPKRLLATSMALLAMLSYATDYLGDEFMASTVTEYSLLIVTFVMAIFAFYIYKKNIIKLNMMNVNQDKI